MFKSEENNNNVMSQESIVRLYGDKFSNPNQNENYTPAHENKIAATAKIDLDEGEVLRVVFKNGATYVSVDHIICEPFELNRNAIEALADLIKNNVQLHESIDAHLEAIKFSLQAIELNKELRKEQDELMQDSVSLLRSIRRLPNMDFNENDIFLDMIEEHANELQSLVGKGKTFMINLTTKDVDIFVDYNKVTSTKRLSEIFEWSVPLALSLLPKKSESNKNEIWDDNWRD